MHLLILPFAVIGLTAKLFSKRLSLSIAPYQEQMQIDSIFASMVNSIDLDVENLNNETK